MLRDLYVPQDRDIKKWNIMRNEVVTELHHNLWHWVGNNPKDEPNDIEREIRQELKEEAERFVISKCKEKYKEFLDLGPYTSSALPFDPHRSSLHEDEMAVPLSTT
jgi:transcriptional accessory protein Tex/SPT6